jgi:hypothetical protein
MQQPYYFFVAGQYKDAHEFLFVQVVRTTVLGVDCDKEANTGLRYYLKHGFRPVHLKLGMQMHFNL